MQTGVRFPDRLDNSRPTPTQLDAELGQEGEVCMDGREPVVRDG